MDEAVSIHKQSLIEYKEKKVLTPTQPCKLTTSDPKQPSLVLPLCLFSTQNVYDKRVDCASLCDGIYSLCSFSPFNIIFLRFFSI